MPAGLNSPEPALNKNMKKKPIPYLGEEDLMREAASEPFDEEIEEEDEENFDSDCPDVPISG